MTQSVDQLSLMLKLDTKSAIVIHLEKFSTLLSQNSVPTVADQKKILIANKNLLNQLINLSSKSKDQNDEWNSKEVRSNDSIRVQLVLDLSSELRLRIIGKLLEIKDQIKRGLETIKDEDKMNLVKDMFEINQDLSKLTFKMLEIEEDQSADDEIHIDKLELTNLEIANLKKELLNKIKQADQMKKVKLLDFEVQDINKFFYQKSKKFSDLFYCGNLAWSIGVGVREKKEKGNQTIKHLAFYLNCENNFDGLNCKAYYELRLLNQQIAGVPKFRTINYTFTRKTGNGVHEFASETELFDMKNGWIKNNTIKLQVYLKILN